MKGVSPFAPVRVTPAQAAHYERQAQRLLEDSLREYDAHVTACQSDGNPLLNKWAWKPLKTHEALSVYKERHPQDPAVNPHFARRSTSANSSSSSSDRPTPVHATTACTPEMAFAMSSTPTTSTSSPFASIALVGTVDGCLSDVMYGLAASETSELLLRSRYMTDSEALDGAVLRSIQTPSGCDPFRVLNLQWTLRGELSRVKTLARRPRDFVVLVASGVLQREVPGLAERQEIGYSLCQSVELPECPELQPQGFTRGWLSTCSLFTQSKTGANRVDVFARAFVDFSGKMAEYQAANMAATLLLNGVADAASCGQSKKLCWMLQRKGATAEMHHVQPAPRSDMSHCGICDRKFGVLSSVGTCNLCRVQMCSRCRLGRDLSCIVRGDDMATQQSRSGDERQDDSNNQLRRLHAIMCKNCIMHVSHQDARVIARHEVEASQLGSEDEAKYPTSSSEGEIPVQHLRSSFSVSTQSGSELSLDPQTPSKMRVWAPGLDTAALRGRSAGLHHSKHKEPTSKSVVLIDETESKQDRLNASFQTPSVQYQAPSSASISTTSSPQEQTRQPLQLEPYQPQHQPQYEQGEPNISYTYAPQHSASTGASQNRAELLRKMEELRMTAESVYQFTSQMNSNTRFRHQQYPVFTASGSSTSISELD
ncbi:hypothetical protein BBJ28_00018711 [Nothophytophthora sp. Chile5]|nr:hypothetical protein BBJ28_00018711 [Nothophytophthora sp. Chile5]